MVKKECLKKKDIIKHLIKEIRNYKSYLKTHKLQKYFNDKVKKIKI